MNEPIIDPAGPSLGSLRIYTRTEDKFSGLPVMGQMVVIWRLQNHQGSAWKMGRALIQQTVNYRVSLFLPVRIYIIYKSYLKMLVTIRWSSKDFGVPVEALDPFPLTTLVSTREVVLVIFSLFYSLHECKFFQIHISSILSFKYYSAYPNQAMPMATECNFDRDTCSWRSVGNGTSVRPDTDWRLATAARRPANLPDHTFGAPSNDII